MQPVINIREFGLLDYKVGFYSTIVSIVYLYPLYRGLWAQKVSYYASIQGMTENYLKY